MFKITGASARDKHPGRVLLEFIKTRPWGSHYRADGRSRVRKEAENLLRDTRQGLKAE